MIRDVLTESLKEAAKKAGFSDVSPILDHPSELSHGDYSTNVALAVAKGAGVSPRVAAEKILEVFEKPDDVEGVGIAGPGFINFRLSRIFFSTQTEAIRFAGDGWGRNKTLEGQKVMVEYTDPNPFKPFHIGHLMSNAVGESIARLISSGNAEVKRANYQGDVGLHVAKCLYPIIEKKWPSETIEEIGKAYVEGARLYEDDMEAKKEIDTLNKKIYEGFDGHVAATYASGRTLSLDHFEDLYAVLGTKFDFYFFESETGKVGAETVKAHPEIFEHSDGATVFHAEKYDPKLHTRVFINSEGLPTYEAKDLGLIQKKRERWPDMHRSITITASEQDAYFRVVQKAIELTLPELSLKVEHVSHGMMQLSGGKMSSRKGNVVTGESLIEDMREEAYEKMAERELGEERHEIADMVAVAAIKYAILRQSSGKNIIFDPEKSLSFEGDSGPYLQYAHTRAVSILKKAEKEGVAARAETAPEETTSLERLLYRFPEVVSRSLEEYEPHHIATYLTELAGVFNSWYAKEQIVGSNDPHSPYKVALTDAFRITMKNGLWMLGIKAPEKM